MAIGQTKKFKKRKEEKMFITITTPPKQMSLILQSLLTKCTCYRIPLHCRTRRLDPFRMLQLKICKWQLPVNILEENMGCTV